MKFTWIKGLTLSLIFSLGLSTRSLWASTPILISHGFNPSGENHKEKANVVKKLLMERWHIPSSLIEMKSAPQPCKKRINQIIHLCFNELGEMLLVTYEKEVVDESFRIFFQ